MFEIDRKIDYCKECLEAAKINSSLIDFDDPFDEKCKPRPNSVNGRYDEWDNILNDIKFRVNRDYYTDDKLDELNDILDKTPLALDYLYDNEGTLYYDGYYSNRNEFFKLSDWFDELDSFLIPFDF